MFIFALVIGIYSYILFFLGISGVLYRESVIGVTVLFWGAVILVSHQVIKLSSHQVAKNFRLLTFNLKTLFVILFVLQAGVNLIGALGPELGFDALWYHLTLPKLWLINHSIEFIPGGLLYYSAMPKLAETLFVAGLAFGNEITVKVIHWGFGLLTCLALYKLSRKFFTPLISLIAVVIFYSNLVVAWESITAYVDLVRAFFEVMALWAFINWIESKKQTWLVWSAVMVGLTITTKLLAIGSLVIFLLLILVSRGKYKVLRMKTIILDTFTFILISLAVPLPWLVFSYINTGNPVYPFFSDIYPVSPEQVSLVGFVREVWGVFMYSPDPISPIYMMLLPVGLWMLWKTRGIREIRGIRMIGVYSILAIVVWYFTPRTGGGRFLLPYLSALSLLCASVVSEVLQQKKTYGVYLGRFLLVIIVGISLISIGYRFVANSKYLPVVLGQQTKEEFLTENLNFSFGDFYDIDGYFNENIKPTDTVLLYGFHNLYYVNFPFVDSSWREEGDSFTYIATQKTDLPREFSDWVLIYENEQSMVKLYQQPQRLFTNK